MYYLVSTAHIYVYVYMPIWVIFPTWFCNIVTENWKNAYIIRDVAWINRFFLLKSVFINIGEGCVIVLVSVNWEEVFAIM